MYDPIDCSPLARIQLRLEELYLYYKSVVYDHVPAATLADFETGCEQLRQAIARDLENGIEKWTSHNAELRSLHKLWCGLGGASSVPDTGLRDCPQRDYDDFFKPRPEPSPSIGIHMSDDDSDRAPHGDNNWGIGPPIYEDPDLVRRRIEEDPATIREYWPPVQRRPRRQKPTPTAVVTGPKTTT